jgi:acyl carrier protein
MTTTTLERLYAIAERELAVESLADKVDTPFAELGIDSLGLVDFMFTVEDELHVNIEHDRAMRTPTLAGLAGLVDELLAAKVDVSTAAVA